MTTLNNCFDIIKIKSPGLGDIWRIYRGFVLHCFISTLGCLSHDKHVTITLNLFETVFFFLHSFHFNLSCLCHSPNMRGHWSKTLSRGLGDICRIHRYALLSSWGYSSHNNYVTNTQNFMICVGGDLASFKNSLMLAVLHQTWDIKTNTIF